MQSVRKQGLLNRYKVKEVNMSNSANIGPYIDRRRMYEMFNKFDSDEKIRISASKLARTRPNFLGDTTELFDVFNKRLETKNTDKDDLYVEVEMPKSRDEGVLIRRVDCEGSDDKEVGFAGATWWMSVESGNLSTMNIYSLKYCPDVKLQVVSEIPKPDGLRAWKYEFRIYGDMDDYVELGNLRGAELINMGAPIPEATVHRGHLEMRGMGRMFCCYKFPMTRMGFETHITDMAWKKGQHVVIDKYMGKGADGKDKMKPGMSFASFETTFHEEARSIVERWMIAGTTPSPKYQGRFTEKTTRRPITTGPSFIDYLSMAGTEFYSVNSFNINTILDRVSREINMNDMSVDDKKKIVVDVITGTPGFTKMILPELRRIDPGCDTCDGIYEKSDHQIGTAQEYTLSQGRTYNSINLMPYGKVKFHVSDMLNKGVLSGAKLYGGYPLSAYWMIIMIGTATGKRDVSSAVKVYVDKMCEQRGYIIGTWTPSGGAYAPGNGGRYRTSGHIGNKYIVYNEFKRALFVPNFKDVHILYPNIAA